ncbi:hypothetical protein VTJ83DRAFT_3364 [Remersonia thermophila]|uniref:DUF6590 domain-containing protein n=1 Tax=Remersonia thermophila TaxID=72144 RepID=A0ABR4DDT5_9PEZI
MDPCWGPWSDWAWDNGSQRWYRARQATDGTSNIEYDFYDATPRGEVDDLAAAISNVDLVGAGSAYSPSSAYTFGAWATSSSAAGAEGYGAYAGSQGQNASSKSKGKGKAKEKRKKSRHKLSDSGHPDSSEYPTGYADGEADPFYEKPKFKTDDAQAHPEETTQEDPSDPYPGVSSSAQRQSLSVEPTSWEPEESSYSKDPFFPAQHNCSSRYPAEEEPHWNPLETGADAEDASRKQPFDQNSVDTYATAEDSIPYPTGEPPSSAVVTQDNGPRLSGVGYTFEEDRETPKLYSLKPHSPQATSPSHIDRGMQYAGLVNITLPGEFNVEPSSRYRPGEVLKILWCEPHGARSDDAFSHRTVSYNGSLFYSGIRRFIIVRTYQGHSSCVPILTYGRLGCKKRGVKPQYHGIIHQHNKKPSILEGEPVLGVPPIKVRLSERTEKISPESRVNYSKLYSIEHNVRVFFIGSVDPDDFRNIFQPAADSCYLQQPMPCWSIGTDFSEKT